MLSHPPSAPILVVEDEPDVRESIALTLQQAGYGVTTAADGQAALEQLRGPEPPSLILLDLMLPVMDGFEFRVRQLEDPAAATIPVIVMSAGEEGQRKVASLGVTAYLTKPVEVETLLQLIRQRRALRTQRHSS